MADSNTPAQDTPPTITPLNMYWARGELIPFLQRVYTRQSRPAGDWERDIIFARHNLDRIVSNVERNSYRQWSS